MCLYLSFDLLLMLQNYLLDLFSDFVIPRLLVQFLLLVVICDKLFQFLQSILFVNNLSPQQRNLILLLLHILLFFCHLHTALHLIPFSHPTLLILHLPLQRYLLPQYLIFHLQYIILCLLYQLIPLLYLTFLNIKHLINELLHLFSLRRDFLIDDLFVLCLLEGKDCYVTCIVCYDYLRGEVQFVDLHYGDALVPNLVLFIFWGFVTDLVCLGVYYLQLELLL